MHSRSRARIRRASVVFALLIGCATLASEANAARVGVLSNRFATDTATDFSAKITGHSFTPVDLASVPTLAQLTANFDVLLLFEDGTFSTAPAVGDVVAQYAKAGHAVVLGTFYDEDRSDGPTSPFTPHGWSTLETIDPNTTDGVGTAYAPRTLDASGIVAHPLTAGVSSLASAKFAGGNEAKPGTTVVATWSQKNARGNPDPAIAYRITGSACVIHVAIAPDYPTVGVAGLDFTGDFYTVWKNAFDFGAKQCSLALPLDPTSIPALDSAALAALALMLAAIGALAMRRRARR